MPGRLRSAFVAHFFLVVCTVPIVAQDQPDRDRGRVMLRDVESDLRRHYFDTTFGGMDIGARFQRAAGRIDSARTNGEIFAIIAQVLLDLNDSHTAFIPPSRAAEVRYGWRPQMIGDTCFIVAVSAESDAWRKGVRVGDRLMAIGRAIPSRREFWKLEYLLRALDPRTAVPLTLQRAENGQILDVVVESDVRERRRVMDLTGRDGGMDLWELIRRSENRDDEYRDELVTVGNVLVWRLPTFSIDDERIDHGIGRARDHEALVLDLRGNGGGYVRALERVVGRLVRDEVLISIERKRASLDSSRSRTGGDVYTGPLIVLVDSRSASASELLAATVRRLGRGVVFGDRTMGAVMASRGYPRQVSGRTAVFYATSITIWDVVLPDGTRLENAGVTPDELILPTGRQLAAGHDPVLARALQRFGRSVDEAQAGGLLSRSRSAMTW